MCGRFTISGKNTQLSHVSKDNEKFGYTYIEHSSDVHISLSMNWRRNKQQLFDEKVVKQGVPLFF